jgi:hypothetical protein
MNRGDACTSEPPTGWSGSGFRVRLHLLAGAMALATGLSLIGVVISLAVRYTIVPTDRHTGKDMVPVLDRNLGRARPGEPRVRYSG